MCYNSAQRMLLTMEHHKSTASTLVQQKNCGQMNMKFDQNYSSIVVRFLITEQGNSSTVVATGTSTIFTDNHHSKVFHSGTNTDNVVMQSVMMTIPSDCEELHKYFGIITFEAVNKSATNHTKVPVLSVQASVNTHGSVSRANTPLLNVAHLILR